ncbi:hypothetical protein B6N60_01174 [Richelia sinica FACHB-800]|uniref:Uncharacterized protein n=1 Tax=Richelia sinica FACHB-800 TaxID=1357546 RepID=A0A975T5A8_9NOST|nr:hypothetical protein B6N60_01174 [Richelia sinica FACHB-800]
MQIKSPELWWKIHLTSSLFILENIQIQLISLSGK